MHRDTRPLDAPRLPVERKSRLSSKTPTAHAEYQHFLVAIGRMVVRQAARTNLLLPPRTRPEKTPIILQYHTLHTSIPAPHTHHTSIPAFTQPQKVFFSSLAPAKKRARRGTARHIMKVCTAGQLPSGHCTAGRTDACVRALLSVSHRPIAASLS